MPIALPCKLSLPDSSGQTVDGIISNLTSTDSPDNILDQGAACNVLYLVTVDMESLTGPSAVGRAINELLSIRPPPVPTTAHFKVSLKGITLTDNHHRYSQIIKYFILKHNKFIVFQIIFPKTLSFRFNYSLWN